VASFSSRGMTTWSLLEGIGNVKPDIVTAGSLIQGLSSQNANQCIVSTGTSVSASIITASIALSLSAIEDIDQRKLV
jgi:subtilisin family serine protease